MLLVILEWDGLDGKEKEHITLLQTAVAVY